MRKLLDKIAGSFRTTEGGYSARKLTAFAFVVMTLSIEVTWLLSGDWIYLTEVLTVNVAFISTLLGLTTWEGIKKQPKVEDEIKGN